MAMGIGCFFCGLGLVASFYPQGIRPQILISMDVCLPVCFNSQFAR